MLPAFLNRLTLLFSTRVLVSGTLPALLLMGYVALLLTFLTIVPVTEFWSASVTLTSVLALLCLIALTYLFESLKTVFTQWMCGRAIFIPKSLTDRWSRTQQSERDKLNLDLRDLTDQQERLATLDTWSERSDQLVAGVKTENVANQAVDDVKADARKYSVDTRTDCLGYFETLVKRLSDGSSAPASKKAVQATKFELDILLKRISRSLDARLNELGRERLARFPQDETISPTRFGNRLAAIDSYTSARYGMDANLIWARLRQANKQADAWQAVDDARAALDFIVSSLWVHVLVACHVPCRGSGSSDELWRGTKCGARFEPLGSIERSPLADTAQCGRGVRNLDPVRQLDPL
jgi:hypothetical protein